MVFFLRFDCENKKILANSSVASLESHFLYLKFMLFLSLKLNPFNKNNEYTF